MKSLSILSVLCCVGFTLSDGSLIRADSTLHTSDESPPLATIIIQTSTNAAGPWTNIKTNQVILPAGNDRFFRLKIGL